MTKPIVGMLVMEQSGVTSMAGSAASLTDLFLQVMRDELIKQFQASLADGGPLKFQVFDLDSGDVLMKLTVDCKKSFDEILKYQPDDASDQFLSGF